MANFLQIFRQKFSQILDFESNSNNASKFVQNKETLNSIRTDQTEFSPSSTVKPINSEQYFDNQSTNQNVENNFKKSSKNTFASNNSMKNSKNNKSLRLNEPNKQQVVSITYEEIGLFPRSFNRVFDRFFKQLFFDVENLVIQEYRFYRYLFLTTVKCVFILLFVPLTINFIAKTYLVRPITEYYWNTHQPQIFLNSYQQKRAFDELQDFEEKIYFESLILSNSNPSNNINIYSTHRPSLFSSESGESPKPIVNKNELEIHSNLNKNQKFGQITFPNSKPNTDFYSSVSYQSNRLISEQSSILVPVNLAKSNESPDLVKNDLPDNSFLVSKFDKNQNMELFSDSVQNRSHEKILELAVHYNEESIEAITNFFADLISFASLCYLFFALEIQINITKSFLLEVFFGLDDSKKSLFILFVTDLLVGYHSPNIWELFFSSFFDHYGLPESQTTIFLLVATLPVLLDVLFKYLIFRHLNRASPATVATYHAMIE